MGYVPNTPEDKKEMLAALGLEKIEQLLEKAVPEELILDAPLDIPEPLSEWEAFSEAAALAASCGDTTSMVNFMGAGAYDHFIPAAVHHITSRPEFATAYTPYQAEVSQGTLQAIFEFQSMVAMLTGMDVANASMYDGPSALAEAVLMAIEETKRLRVIVPEHLHPYYLKVLRTYTKPTGVEIIQVGAKGGVTDTETLSKMMDDKIAAVVVQNPNFVGCIEDGFAFQKAVADTGALLIAVVDPISLGILTPPGEYGADIVVGEGQSLGNPLGFGGPYLGFFAAREKFVRKMPGRLIGASSDSTGIRGFVMTLQTREQHIRREKATSNICTNQALCALAATVYLSLVGEEGFKKVANLCFDKAHYLAGRLAQVESVTIVYNEPFFKEFAVRLPGNAEAILQEMAAEGYLAGVPMKSFFTDRPNEMLIAVTEKRTKSEMDQFTETLADVLKN